MTFTSHSILVLSLSETDNLSLSPFSHTNTNTHTYAHPHTNTHSRAHTTLMHTNNTQTHTNTHRCAHTHTCKTHEHTHARTFTHSACFKHSDSNDILFAHSSLAEQGIGGRTCGKGREREREGERELRRKVMKGHVVLGKLWARRFRNDFQLYILKALKNRLMQGSRSYQYSLLNNKYSTVLLEWVLGTSIHIVKIFIVQFKTNQWDLSLLL